MEDELASKMQQSQPVVELEPRPRFPLFIWSHLVEFVPVRGTSVGAIRAEAHRALTTVLSLRLICRETAELLHPTRGATLWKRLLLLTFDFTLEYDSWQLAFYGYEVEIKDPFVQNAVKQYYQEKYASGSESSEAERSEGDNRHELGSDTNNDSEGDILVVGEATESTQGALSPGGEEVTEEESDAFEVASEGDSCAASDMSEGEDGGYVIRGMHQVNYLQESYAYFPALDIRIRPSHYSFLSKVQALSSAELDLELALPRLWPTHECAFSMFCDLVALLSLPRGLCTQCEACDAVTPVLVAPLDNDTQQASLEFALQDATGIAPFFWERGTGVSESRFPGKATSICEPAGGNLAIDDD